jgi:hypothetical protein
MPRLWPLSDLNSPCPHFQSLAKQNRRPTEPAQNKRVEYFSIARFCLFLALARCLANHQFSNHRIANRNTPRFRNSPTPRIQTRNDYLTATRKPQAELAISPVRLGLPSHQRLRVWLPRPMLLTRLRIGRRPLRGHTSPNNQPAESLRRFLAYRGSDGKKVARSGIRNLCGPEL